MRRILSMFLCLVVVATLFMVSVPRSIGGTNGINYELINFTSHPANDLSPTWSPDGSRIAFVSNRDGSYGLWIINSDGSNPHKIVIFSNQGGFSNTPKWSPDGSKIAFWDNNLYTISPTGSNKIMIKATYTAEGHGIAWSPDSTKLAYIRQPNEGNWDYNNELYIDDFVGGILPPPDTRLTIDSEDDGHPEWTLDGQNIVWTSGRDSTYPHSPSGGSHYDIYRMNLNDGTVTRLTTTKGAQFPRFSPDGNKIVWTNYDHQTHLQTLWLMDSDGSNQQLLLDNNARNLYPSWSPDGNKIAFASNKAGNWDIWIIDLNPKIDAVIDIDPNTLNLKSKGKWITCYIELPEGYDVNEIEISSIMLEDVIPAEWGDVQNDILMVKFDRSEVEDMLSPGTYNFKVTGELTDGTSFEGYSDEISVIAPP